MEPKKQIPTEASDDSIAVEHIKAIVSEYDLPEHYQSLVNGPWRLVAQALIRGFGEDSDAWSRMNWFSRILCTAIESSLERDTPEAVNDALNGFSIWLNSLREEGEAYSMCLSAANYAQRRIAAQIAEDTATAEHTEDTQSESPEASDEACVLPGAEAVDIEGITEPEAFTETPDIPELAEPEATKEETEPEPISGTITEESIESLSLSLAYSANSSLDEQEPESEQPMLPEKTERDTTMETQPTVAATQDNASQLEASNSSPETLSMSSHLTDAASIAPVPMGTWLAFHDQDTPTLARLAMYDTSDDMFMLGNKSGILVRKISKAELSSLIEGELVQLVEFRSVAK